MGLPEVWDVGQFEDVPVDGAAELGSVEEGFTAARTASIFSKGAAGG